MKKSLFLMVGWLFLALLFCQNIFPQTTEFSYQGSLKNGANAANGNYDFEFALYDALSGGAQVGSTIALNNVAVTNGTFSVKLDFGNQFAGANRFLEIRLRPSGQPGITILSPRQLINSAPYSVKSLTADNAATATNALQLGGVTANQYVLTNDLRLSDARNPLPNSPNYIQNTNSQQASSNFNISGNGTIGGNLSVGGAFSLNIVNANTQYNLGGSRVLSNAGTNNLFVGVDAGTANTTGSNNAFFGSYTGYMTTTGYGNAFFGSGAGERNTTAVYNAFFGADAGRFNTTGYDNTFFGFRAGFENTTGLRNTIIGAFADVGAGNLFNANAIGTEARVSRSNSLVLGNAYVNVGVGTSAPDFKLEVIDSANTGLRVQTNTTGGTVASFGGFGEFQIDSPGVVGGRFRVAENGLVTIGSLAPGSLSLCINTYYQISNCSSSIRYKSNINPFRSGLSLVQRLRPVSFNWKDGGMFDFGLIAEEVSEVEPLLVTRNSKGEIEGVKYDRLNIVLINAVKEQQTQIELMQKQVEKQREEIAALKALVCLQNVAADLCRQKD